MMRTSEKKQREKKKLAEKIRLGIVDESTKKKDPKRRGSFI